MRELTKEEQVIYRFSQGDSDAGLEALELYEPFLRNYRRIFQGNPNPEVWEMKRFARLFLSPKRARAIALIKGKDQIVSHVLHWIYEATAHVDREDLDAEINNCFLECCRRFDPAKGKFGMYLKLKFRYDFFSIHLRPWLNYLTPQLPDGEGASYDSIPQYLEYEASEELAMTLGASWVWGASCSSAFRPLTPLERWVLVERYVEKRRVGDIARQMGVRMGIATQTIRRAVAKLESSASSHRLLHQP